MENLDLGALIQDVISKFSVNRVGVKPPVLVTIPAAGRYVPWKDKSLKQFVKILLYGALLSNDPEASLEVIVHRRSELTDLAAFVGVSPHFWLQLRVSGRGLRIQEKLVEELFSDVGYRCDEWVGVESTNALLGIFSASNNDHTRLVFCIESNNSTRKCDLLLPICQAYLTGPDHKH